MEPGSQIYPWFAVQVRNRWEKTVAGLLQGKGFEYFLPTYLTRKRWSDRIRDVELPLFPGYVFCRFDPYNRLPVLVTPGVVQVVGVARSPLPVAEEEIAAIQKIVRSGLVCQPWPFLHVGDRVRIEYGPLASLEGILLSFKGQHRVVISVSILQRAVSVEIEGAWVNPVGARQPVSAALPALRAVTP